MSGWKSWLYCWLTVSLSLDLCLLVSVKPFLNLEVTLNNMLVDLLTTFNKDENPLVANICAFYLF